MPAAAQDHWSLVSCSAALERGARKSTAVVSSTASDKTVRQPGAAGWASGGGWLARGRWCTPQPKMTCADSTAMCASRTRCLHVARQRFKGAATTALPVTYSSVSRYFIAPRSVQPRVLQHVEPPMPGLMLAVCQEHAELVARVLRQAAEEAAAAGVRTWHNMCSHSLLNCAISPQPPHPPRWHRSPSHACVAPLVR